MGVDTWDTAPISTEVAGWKPDDAGVAVGGWKPDTSGADDGFTGEFAQENISKHADGDFGGATADGGCRICGDEAHFARDCPDKKPNSGECYRCGEMGHNKADCTNEPVEREFTGECRACGETGHRAADCPSKPAQVCKLCSQEGHIAKECNVNRIITNFSNLGITEMSVEDAWAEVEKADTAKDMNDMKTAILTYARAYPEVTLPELESVFRDADMNTYLIAQKKEISDVHAIINLQGKGDQSYVVSFQLSAKPRRPKLAEGWPESAEENMTRLGEAGFIMDGLVEKCSNCNQLRHGSRKCTEEKVEKVKQVPTCLVCSQEGHYARDCTEPRKVPGAKECKECGEVGHIAKECPAQVCRNCGESGHRAKECENERVVQCRNCSEYGHMSKECPLPTDWSKVKCSRCGELGHSYKRCSQPPPDDAPAVVEGGGWDDGAGGGGADSGGW